jgi:rubrerythrin
MSDHELLEPSLAGVRTEEGELSRGDVLIKGSLAAGALYGLGAIGPYVLRALAASGSELETLNFLLWFEYMQATLYGRGNSEVNDKGEKLPLKSGEKELVELLLAQERQHIAAMRKLIERMGGKPKKEDQGEFAFAFRFQETLWVLAGEVETAAIGTYNGAIPLLKSKEARELASSIVQVEGRHAAMVASPLQLNPAPEAFNLGLDQESAIGVTEQFTGAFLTGVFQK